MQIETYVEIATSLEIEIEIEMEVWAGTEAQTKAKIVQFLKTNPTYSVVINRIIS